MVRKNPCGESIKLQRHSSQKITNRPLSKTIPNELRQRAETWVSEVEQDFLRLSKRLREKWQDFYKLVRTFENEQPLPGQSDIFIPKIWEIIEKKTPAVIAHNPKFIAYPRNNDAITYTQSIRDVLEAWWEEQNMTPRMEKWVKEGFIYGTSPAKVGWKQEIKEIEEEEEILDPETGETTIEKIKTEVVVSEGPTFETRSIFDVLVDPRVETFEESIGIIDVIDNVRLPDLLSDSSFDLSRIKRDRKDYAAGMDDSLSDEEKRESQEDMGVDWVKGEIDKGTLTVKEYWGRFCPSEDPLDEEEYVITTVWQAGKCLDVIKCEKNKYGFRPFTKFDDHVIQGEFYGIGEVEPLEGLQIEYNNIRNARIDFNNSINYPEWMYNLNAGINPVNLVHKPNNLIPVEVPIGTDINTVLRTIEKPVAPQSGYMEEGQLNRDFQTISQTVDYTDRGGSKGFSSTATGIASRDAERSQQINNVVRHLEDAISQIGTMWLRLAAHFVEDEIVIRRKRTDKDVERELMEAGPEGVVPTTEEAPQKFTKVAGSVFKDIEENYTIKVEAGSTTAYSALGKAQDATNIGNLAAQFTALGVPINNELVFMDILRDSYQKSNPEKYIKAPQGQMAGGEQGQPPMPGSAPEGGTAMPANIPKAPFQPSQPNITPQG